VEEVAYPVLVVTEEGALARLTALSIPVEAAAGRIVAGLLLATGPVEYL
jgi:hypothetical protein